jgi:hypothetical protein
MSTFFSFNRCVKKREMMQFNKDTDFLNEPRFIEWRLFRTEESERFWAKFIEDHPYVRDELNDAIRQFQSLRLSNSILHESTSDVLLQRIRDGVERHKKKKLRIRYMMSAAASIALIIVGSWVFFNTPKTAPVMLSEETIAFQTLPSDNIRLVHGNKVVELEQNATVSVESEEVSVAEGDKKTQVASSEKTMSRLIVPAGKRSMVQLFDGTKIWINSGSELGFFSDGTREISIRGEIYLEVAKKEGKPFYVNTPDFKVSVLGTKFNISAYADNDCQSVVLVEGSVMVEAPGHESVKLMPDEMFSMNAGNISKADVSASEYVTWKDGILIFNQTPVSDVLKTVGRYYNVHFTLRNAEQIYKGTCTGKLFLPDDMNEMLEALSVLSTSKYYKENEIIYLER